MNDKQSNLTKLYKTMKPGEDLSPAEKEIYWKYMYFQLEYCAPLIVALKNENFKVVFPKQEKIYEAFCKANGGKKFYELVRELDAEQ